MSKYRGPRLRVIRRLGALSAFSQKIPKCYNFPGQHSEKHMKPTQFSYRLAEKQKLRFYYGIFEKKSVRCMIAARKASGSTGEVLIKVLEKRLDNLVYRIGLAPTVPAARQLVNHGYIFVNTKCVTIPSFSCFQSHILIVQYQKIIRRLITNNIFIKVFCPTHIIFDIEKKIANITRQSDQREVPLNLKELFVVEYYSNRL